MNTQNTKDPIRDFYIYLISDATGTTLQGLARACLAQFEGIHPVERFWPMVRTQAQLERAMYEIEDNPGPVLFTLVDTDHRRQLQNLCYELDVPCMPILDPILRSLSSYTGLPSKGVPGLQHALDEAYFKRIDAMDFALRFDDGRNVEDLEDAEVILVGVSRTSKTPTCIYLARRGIKAANIPLVPSVPFPEDVVSKTNALFVGLVENPERLVQVRRSRLKADEMEIQHRGNAYMDLDAVREEVQGARKLFSKHKWPVIDVTRRSVEETAAEITFLLQKHRKKQKEGAA